MREFDAYMYADDTWFRNTYPNLKDEQIAYFSFEYGLHESLMVYAGGLGVLSGDHLKEASDLGLPLVAVGFLYTFGYFSQKISEDGWQEARNIELNFNDLPLIALYDEKHNPIKISIELPGRNLFARLYELNIGRNKLILMHTNIPEIISRIASSQTACTSAILNCASRRRCCSALVDFAHCSVWVINLPSST